MADLHGRQVLSSFEVYCPKPQKGMRSVLNNLGALSQFAVNFGITEPPIGPKKKEAAVAAVKGALERALLLLKS